MTLTLSIPTSVELRPKITVVGVGGAGGNAVNNMIESHLEGVEFVACNTDAQALSANAAAKTIQLGADVTHGLGAGAKPEIGRAAAEESMDEVLEALQGSNMVFITAGMGGGTGTGAAPVIARAVRDQGILTVGVVTKPFQFEGAYRMRLAEAGIEDLQQHVDTLIVIPNQNLFRLATAQTTFGDSFKMADQVLHMGVRGVTDLMVKPGLVNLDFADIRTVMSEMGKAMMGTGEAQGEDRAIEAAEAAISNPLLDEVSMRGAAGVLINITGGLDMTLFEVDAAANRIREEVDNDANIIFGSTFDAEAEGTIRVSVVATGIVNPDEQQAQQQAAGAVRFVPQMPGLAARTPKPAPARTEISAATRLNAAIDGQAPATGASAGYAPPAAQNAPYAGQAASPAAAPRQAAPQQQPQVQRQAQQRAPQRQQQAPQAKAGFLQQMRNRFSRAEEEAAAAPARVEKERPIVDELLLDADDESLMVRESGGPRRGGKTPPAEADFGDIPAFLRKRENA